MPTPYIPILSYHRVVAGLNSPFCTSPDEFRRQMQWFKDNDYRGVTIAEAVAQRAGRSWLNFKAFTLTFDHGYADNYRNAFPILKEFHVPAHFFVIPDLIDSKQMAPLPGGVNTDPERDRLMSWDEVATLKEAREATMEIGTMPASGQDLLPLAPAAALEEITRARDSIRGFVGFNPDYFALPAGPPPEALKAALKDAGFKGAVYTPEGKTGGFDRYSLRRIRIQSGLSDKAWKFKISEAADTLRENPTLFGIKKTLGQAFD